MGEMVRQLQFHMVVVCHRFLLEVHWLDSFAIVVVVVAIVVVVVIAIVVVDIAIVVYGAMVFIIV